MLEILNNVSFDSPNDLNVYYDVAYVRSNIPFEVVGAFAEFGDLEFSNEDDKVVYICKDGKIRVCGFKDYSMNDVEVIDLFDGYIPANIKMILMLNVLIELGLVIITCIVSVQTTAFLS